MKFKLQKFENSHNIAYWQTGYSDWYIIPHTTVCNHLRCLTAATIVDRMTSLSPHYIVPICTLLLCGRPTCDAYLYRRFSYFGCLSVVDLRLDVVVILLILVELCCRQNVTCNSHSCAFICTKLKRKLIGVTLDLKQV